MICSPGSSRHLEKDGQGLAKPASACAKTFLISLILAYGTITFALPLTGVWQSRCWWGGFVAGLSRSGESTEHCCYCLGWPSKSEKSSGQLLIINVSNIIVKELHLCMPGQAFPFWPRCQAVAAKGLVSVSGEHPRTP